MPMSINSNPLAHQTQQSLAKTQEALTRSFERISSGRRINRASDDASGMQMAEAMRADTRSYVVAMRNINDGVSMLNIADSTLETGNEILGRMSELATQAANGTLNDAQRSALNDEYQALQAELDRTQSTAQFNGSPVAGTTTLQSGIDSSADSQTTVNIASISSSTLGTAGSDLLSADNARNAMERVSAAADTLSASRGEIGSTMSRLGQSLSNLSSQYVLTAQSLSTKEDVDVAEESGNLATGKIKQQAAVALNAQANLSQETVLKLLG